MKSLVLRLFIVAMVLLLSACLSVKEEFWFENDGSGRIEATYEMPAIAIASLGGEEKLKSLIEGILTKESGVTLDQFSLEKRGAQAALTIHVHFDSVLQLSKLLDPPSDGSKKESMPEPMKKLLGDIKVKRVGMAVDYQRSIDPSQLFAGGLFSPSREQMKDYQLEYIMHLPTKATQTNAHQILDDGYTLAWRYDLADAIKDPVTTNFTTPLPIPWWLWLVLAIVIAFLVWRGLVIRRKLLRRRADQ